MCSPCNFIIRKPDLLCKIFYKVTFGGTLSRSESDGRCTFLLQNTWCRNSHLEIFLSDFQFFLDLLDPVQAYPPDCMSAHLHAWYSVLSDSLH